MEKTYGIIPNSSIACIILMHYTKQGQVDKAADLFLTLNEKIPPDLKQFTILIKGYIYCSRLPEAIQTFNRMQEIKILPDSYLLNLIISGLLKQNKTDEALSLFIEMEERYPNIPKTEDRYLFNSFILHQLKNNNPEKAEQWLTSLKEISTPLPSTLRAMAQAYLKEGSIDKALGIYRELNNEADIYTINRFIEYYARRLEMDQVERFFLEMEQKKSVAR